MGFFDIFRRKKEPEMPEALVKVYKLFFPEGRGRPVRPERGRREFERVPAAETRKTLQKEQ